MFGVKDGYRENPGPVYFRDDVTLARGIVFQPDVYRMAALLAGLLRRAGGVAVLDVGCGYGGKLASMHAEHPEFEYSAIDYGDNLAWCKQHHTAWGHFYEQDLEEPFVLQDPPDVVICSDVIEHLVNPMPLLASIRATRAHVVWSTPERDVEHGPDHMGPSPNLCHVREWNGPELRALLRLAGFEVLWYGLTRGNDAGEAMATQIVITR